MAIYRVPRADGRLIGVGFSTFTEQTAHGTKVFAAWGLPLAPGFEQATVKLTASGTVEVHSGNHRFGQGLDDVDAQALVEELTQWATQDRFVYEHAWQQHDVVMWDNTWTMHLVMPYDAATQRRVMHRTNFAGVEAVL